MSELGNTILTGISDFFTALFVPDSEKISANIDEVKNYFAFVEDIRELSNYIFDSFHQSAVKPSISINFSTADSKYGFNAGGTVKAFDLAWYEKYKPMVDTIIVAFAYAVFILNIFRRLPGIIAGSDAVENGNGKVDNNKS